MGKGKRNRSNRWGKDRYTPFADMRALQEHLVSKYAADCLICFGDPTAPKQNIDTTGIVDLPPSPKKLWEPS